MDKETMRKALDANAPKPRLWPTAGAAVCEILMLLNALDAARHGMWSETIAWVLTLALFCGMRLYMAMYRTALGALADLLADDAAGPEPRPDVQRGRDSESES